MKNFSDAVTKFLQRQGEPTATEYAVTLALIFVVCLTAIATLGTNAQGDQKLQQLLTPPKE